MASSSSVDLASNISANDILRRDFCDDFPFCPPTGEPIPRTDSTSGGITSSTRNTPQTTSHGLSSIFPSSFPSSTTETSTFAVSASSTNTSKARPALEQGPVKLPTITPASGKTSVKTPGAAPAFTSTSLSVPSSTPQIEEFSSPEVTSHASANRPTTSSSLQTSSNAPSPLQSQVPTMTSSSPSHRVSRSIPTPALAGAIAFVIMATAAAIILSFWLRRRRARARASLSPQNSTLRSFTSDNSAAATAPIVRPLSNVSSKAQANNSGSGTSTHTRSLVSESSHSTRFGNATSQESSASFRTLPTYHAEHKDSEGYGRQFPIPLEPPSNSSSTEYLPDRAESLPGAHAMSQDNVTTAPGLVTAGAHEERLLHLALPWAFGQRVLAIMAGDDARSVHSGNSEPLPAYEPRR